jgi:methyl-accepting chemotaxis protein
LIADILPPPEFVIEPYVEAALIARDPANLDVHVERLKNYVRNMMHAMPIGPRTRSIPSCVNGITHATHDSAMEFWNALDNRLLPAARSGDREAIDLAFWYLTIAYDVHREAVVDTVKLATDYQQRLKDQAANVCTRRCWCSAF